jgi:hypothetical protein
MEKHLCALTLSGGCCWPGQGEYYGTIACQYLTGAQVRGFARVGLNSRAIRCGAYPHTACSAQPAVLCACPESVGVTRGLNGRRLSAWPMVSVTPCIFLLRTAIWQAPSKSGRALLLELAVKGRVLWHPQAACFKEPCTAAFHTASSRAPGRRLVSNAVHSAGRRQSSVCSRLQASMQRSAAVRLAVRTGAQRCAGCASVPLSGARLGCLRLRRKVLDVRRTAGLRGGGAHAPCVGAMQACGERRAVARGWYPQPSRWQRSGMPPWT